MYVKNNWKKKLKKRKNNYNKKIITYKIKEKNKMDKTKKLFKI